jgi:hypothetical protein
MIAAAGRQRGDTRHAAGVKKSASIDGVPVLYRLSTYFTD